MHHHPFANPTLSPGKKKKPPPKLNYFIYTEFGQNRSYWQAVTSHRYKIDWNSFFWSRAVAWGT
jgi:hypothetical protein